MIPALLGTWKAATWAQRGITAGVCAGVLLAAFGWGYLKGVNSCEQEHLAEVASQAMHVGKHEASKSVALANVDEKHDAKSRINDDTAKVVTHEIIRYVHDPKSIPCNLPVEYGRLVDRIDRLQRTAESRVPDAHPTTQEADELQARGITSHQLLLGYHALTDARRKDVEIIEFAQEEGKTRYENEMAFYDSIHAEQMKAADLNGYKP